MSYPNYPFPERPGFPKGPVFCPPDDINGGVKSAMESNPAQEWDRISNEKGIDKSKVKFSPNGQPILVLREKEIDFSNFSIQTGVEYSSDKSHALSYDDCEEIFSIFGTDADFYIKVLGLKDTWNDNGRGSPGCSYWVHGGQPSDPRLQFTFTIFGGKASLQAIDPKLARSAILLK